MAWEIEYTDQFEVWWNTLTEEERRRVRAAVEMLEEQGPALSRPFADVVQGSRYANMKELRPRGGNLRIFFIFDPRRIAILLIAGDKTNHWREFYTEMIPHADSLYDEHLEQLRKEGLRSDG